MTGQHEPDPNNRFETWADGMTPSGQQSPPSGWPDASAKQNPTWSPAADPTSGTASGSAPPAWTPSSSTPDPRPSESGPSFPTYPYSSSSAPHVDPQQDEAFAAFRGYQAGTQGFPHQSLQSHQGPYSRAPHPYGATRRLNAPFAVPSLVLGIISVFCGGITGPIGLGLGIAALKQTESDARALGGRGLAIAGIATSAVGSFILLMFILGIIAS